MARGSHLGTDLESREGGRRWGPTPGKQQRGDRVVRGSRTLKDLERGYWEAPESHLEGPWEGEKEGEKDGARVPPGER